MLTNTIPATIEEYERLPEGAPYQLIAGELIMSPSPTPLHQRIIRSLVVTLDDYIELHQLGRLFFAPLDVPLSDSDVYQPDLIFVKSERVPLIGRDRFNIIPDLVVEILSPSTAYYDFTKKKSKYCESGVTEYWIVDPEESTVEIMIKDGQYYRTEALLHINDMLESPMFPGFRMKLTDVFAF